MAGPGEFAAKELAATKKTSFNGAFGDAEGAGGGRNILFVEIEEQNGVPILGG